MSDQERLGGYIDVWWQAINDFTELLEEIPAEQWSAPTDLAGWDVRAVASHIAHLESVLAGTPEETVDIGSPDHVTDLMSAYTEQGVVSRRDHEPDDIINEIRESATRRHTRLLTDPPTDASARPDHVFGGIGWDWQTLLRNRPLDVWMHEQDVRRAVARPGGMDSLAAQHTTDYLAESLPVVVARRVGAPSGTSVVLEVEGSAPVAVLVDENGRGRRIDPPADPAVRIRTDRENFILLAGGRCPPVDGSVIVEGDTELGARIVDTLAVTP